MIPDFETWQRSKPLAPGTKIRLQAPWRVWWHGLEATIIKQDPKSLEIYHTTPITNGVERPQHAVHRDNFVVIDE